MSRKSHLRMSVVLPIIASGSLAFAGFAFADLVDDGGNPEAVSNIQIAEANPCGTVGDNAIDCYVPRLREAAEANPEAAAGNGGGCNPCAGGAVIELTPERSVRRLCMRARRDSGSLLGVWRSNCRGLSGLDDLQHGALPLRVAWIALRQ